MKLIVFDVSGTLQDDSPYAPMYDGMKALIVALKKADISVALATNLSRSGLNRFIAKNELKSYLDADITLSEAAPKPNPEMLETVMLKTGVDPTDTLMVGDGVGDIHMAHLAKVQACAVNFQGKWGGDVLHELPEYKVESLKELCHILSDFTGKTLL